VERNGGGTKAGVDKGGGLGRAWIYGNGIEAFDFWFIFIDS